MQNNEEVVAGLSVQLLGGCWCMVWYGMVEVCEGAPGIGTRVREHHHWQTKAWQHTDGPPPHTHTTCHTELQLPKTSSNEPNVNIRGLCL